MNLREVGIGNVYILNAENESVFKDGAQVKVLQIDDDQLIEIELADGSDYRTAWVDAWELDMLPSLTDKLKARKQEFLDMFQQCIKDETIQIESTPHGAIRISVNGKRLIES